MLIANISHLRSFLERHSFRVFMILGWRRWRNIDLGLLSSDLFFVFVFFILWIIVLHRKLWLFFFFFFRFRFCTVLFRCFVVLILKVIFYVIIVFLVIAKMKF